MKGRYDRMDGQGYFSEYTKTTDILEDFIELEGIKKGATNEETLCRVFHRLGSKEEMAKLESDWRRVFVSASALALNGLPKIKDPLKLYILMARAFEEKGYCIFTETVTNALMRVQGEAVKKGKLEEVLKVVRAATNAGIKNALSPMIPKKVLMHLADNVHYGAGAGRALGLRKDLTTADLKELLLKWASDVPLSNALTSMMRKNPLKTINYSELKRFAKERGIHFVPHLNALNTQSKNGEGDASYKFLLQKRKEDRKKRLVPDFGLKSIRGKKRMRTLELQKRTNGLRR